MPAPSAKTPAPAAPPAASYPAIESLVERASAEELGTFFEQIKAGLTQLKGPKAEQAKKIQTAIGSAEELLQHLLATRGQLEAEKRAPKRR
jgi:hypothetical protein